MRENVVEMIRKLRRKLGLTQEQFAAKVGVTFSTVNRWENGRSAPSPLALTRIDALGLTHEQEIPRRGETLSLGFDGDLL